MGSHLSLFASIDVEVRKRAADVARRITERDGSLLEDFANELAGLLEVLPTEESRTRWHLGLVVPRVARTRMQRLRAARTMGLLALQEDSLRDEAEEMVARFLQEGTRAMKNWARTVQKMWARADRKKQS